MVHRGRSLYSLLVLLPLALALPSTAPSASATEGAEEEVTWGADVKIEVRQENGKIATHKYEVIAMGHDWNVDFEGQGHQHQVFLNIQKTDPKTLSVKMGYARDGSPIIAPFSLDFTPKKREVVWTDDGKIALALTIKPKKMKKEDTTRDEGEQVKPDGSDDPLGSKPIN